MGDSETLVGSIGGVGGGGRGAGGSIATASKTVGTVVKGTPLVVTTPDASTTAGRNTLWGAWFIRRAESGYCSC